MSHYHWYITYWDVIVFWIDLGLIWIYCLCYYKFQKNPLHKPFTEAWYKILFVLSYSKCTTKQMCAWCVSKNFNHLFCNLQVVLVFKNCTCHNTSFSALIGFSTLCVPTFLVGKSIQTPSVNYMLEQDVLYTSYFGQLTNCCITILADANDT